MEIGDENWSRSSLRAPTVEQITSRSPQGVCRGRGPLLVHFDSLVAGVDVSPDIGENSFVAGGIRLSLSGVRRSSLGVYRCIWSWGVYAREVCACRLMWGSKVVVSAAVSLTARHALE